MVTAEDITVLFMVGLFRLKVAITEYHFIGCWSLIVDYSRIRTSDSTLTLVVEWLQNVIMKKDHTINKYRVAPCYWTTDFTYNSRAFSSYRYQVSLRILIQTSQWVLQHRRTISFSFLLLLTCVTHPSLTSGVSLSLSLSLSGSLSPTLFTVLN